MIQSKAANVSMYVIHSRLKSEKYFFRKNTKKYELYIWMNYDFKKITSKMNENSLRKWFMIAKKVTESIW